MREVMRTPMKFIKTWVWCLLLPWALVAVGCNTKPVKDEKKAVKIQQRYRCPMHHEIIRDKPGTCPICGMDLVAFDNEEKAVTDVSLNTLLRPTNIYVLSSVPV